MRRIIARTLRRVAGRVELWNGNRERWRNFFTLDKEESVIAWAWQTHARNRARYEAAMADPLLTRTFASSASPAPEPSAGSCAKREIPRLTGRIRAYGRIQGIIVHQTLPETRILTRK